MALEIGSLSAETTVRASPAPRTTSSSTGTANIVAIRGDRQELAGERVSDVTEKTSEEIRAQKQAVEEALSKTKELPQQVRRSLEFRLDEDYGRPIITIKDIETSEVIRQIPPEEIVEFSKYLRELAESNGERLTGLVVRLEA